jgi:non-ribosomal peptide synthetase component E (peptide arylation enzyme)
MAEVKNTFVEKSVTKVEKVPAYALTLSKDEALAVMVLVGNVTGSSQDSPRKHADAVYAALYKAGLSVVGTDLQRQLQGSIRFNVSPKPKPSYHF